MFHRLLCPSALLYTEMVVADAVIYGDRDRLLGFAPAEHPVAVQLGGSDPDKLAQATNACVDWGYDEVNLNVGCPSDRVQSGTFGACLMREPQLVANCIAAMHAAADGRVPITVKCRIGVDDQMPEQALFELADKVWAVGCDGLWVHARKAWLQGLSPKENRNIPPLDYAIVHRLKAENPERFIGMNGGLRNWGDCVVHLDTLDGVMVGRAAYENPDILRDVEGPGAGAGSAEYWNVSADIISAMADYAAIHIETGGKLHHITRHMTGLFHGLRGARQWRRSLSEQGVKPDADVSVLIDSFEQVRRENTQNASAA